MNKKTPEFRGRARLHAARPPGSGPPLSGVVLLPLPEALDVAVPGRGHHHEPLGRVLEHQDAQLPSVGQQQLKVHLRQELVIQDAWGPQVRSDRGERGGEKLRRGAPGWQPQGSGLGLPSTTFKY